MAKYIMRQSRGIEIHNQLFTSYEIIRRIIRLRPCGTLTFFHKKVILSLGCPPKWAQDHIAIFQLFPSLILNAGWFREGDPSNPKKQWQYVGQYFFLATHTIFLLPQGPGPHSHSQRQGVCFLFFCFVSPGSLEQTQTWMPHGLYWEGFVRRILFFFSLGKFCLSHNLFRCPKTQVKWLGF